MAVRSTLFDQNVSTGLQPAHACMLLLLPNSLTLVYTWVVPLIGYWYCLVLGWHKWACHACVAGISQYLSLMMQAMIRLRQKYCSSSTCLRSSPLMKWGAITQPCQMLCLPTLGMLLQLHTAAEKKGKGKERKEYTFWPPWEAKYYIRLPRLALLCNWEFEHCSTCCSGALLQASGCVACCCCFVLSVIASFSVAFNFQLSHSVCFTSCHTHTMFTANSSAEEESLSSFCTCTSPRYIDFPADIKHVLWSRQDLQWWLTASVKTPEFLTMPASS